MQKEYVLYAPENDEKMDNPKAPRISEFEGGYFFKGGCLTFFKRRFCC